jgi:hypothetical protein
MKRQTSVSHGLAQDQYWVPDEGSSESRRESLSRIQTPGRNSRKRGAPGEWVARGRRYQDRRLSSVLSISRHFIKMSAQFWQGGF